jgi:hypothetical protein
VKHWAGRGLITLPKEYWTEDYFDWVRRELTKYRPVAYDGAATRVATSFHME